MKTYEYVHRNKFIGTDASSLDELIGDLQRTITFLQLCKDRNVSYSNSDGDDYHWLKTTDPVVAHELEFEEVEFDDGEYEPNEDEEE